MASKLHGHQPTKVAGEAYSDEVRAKAKSEMARGKNKTFKTESMPEAVSGSVTAE